MRIGVLDIGSNTGHLLIVDAYDGGPPIPAYSSKEPLRLAEHLDADGRVDDDGIAQLVAFVRSAKAEASDRGCTEIIAFATSAVRGATNSDDVIDEVRRLSEVKLEILPGDVEAQLTFLAARRWFGWSSGRLGVFDIGGGSLELAVGSDEVPDVARSLPLGAGRLTRAWMSAGKGAAQMDVAGMRLHVRRTLAEDAGSVLRGGAFDHAVATSKTLRSLARMCGAAPYTEGLYVRRLLHREDLRKLAEQLANLQVREIADLPGVSSNRAHQMLAGAVVAESVMDLFDLEQLEICPWALREGVLLQRIDQL